MGRPVGIRDGQRIDEFLAKLEQGGDGCWEWWGSKNVDGYGVIFLDSKRVFVHRLAYELMVVKIPDGLTIDHLCRKRACFNPLHLEAVSQGENVLRGMSQWAQNARKTHCLYGHEFSVQNTGISNNGGRRCRACDRYRHKAYYQRRKYGNQ